MADHFSEGNSYEVIITTVNKLGVLGEVPNAAAIGMTVRGGELRFRVHKGTNTYENLEEDPRFGINMVTHDEIDLVARAALYGWGSAEPEFDADDYEIFDRLPFLKAASVQISCEMNDVDREKGNDDHGGYEVMTFGAVVKDERVLKKEAGPIERGSSPVLEALVNVTRWSISDPKLKKDLRAEVEKDIERVRKVGPKAVQRAILIVEEFMGRER